MNTLGRHLYKFHLPRAHHLTISTARKAFVALLPVRMPIIWWRFCVLNSGGRGFQGLYCWCRGLRIDKGWRFCWLPIWPFEDSLSLQSQIEQPSRPRIRSISKKMAFVSVLERVQGSRQASHVSALQPLHLPRERKGLRLVPIGLPYIPSHPWISLGRVFSTDLKIPFRSADFLVVKHSLWHSSGPDMPAS